MATCRYRGEWGGGGWRGGGWGGAWEDREEAEEDGVGGERWGLRKRRRMGPVEEDRD